MVSLSTPPTTPLRSAATGTHVASLDVVRAVAALAVLGSHATGFFQGNQQPLTGISGAMRFNLNTGVDLFFALSGFLIARPFVRALLEGSSPPSQRRYLLRRAARIVPAYWIALTITVVALTPPAATWWRLGAHFMLLQNLVPGPSRAVFAVSWTLSIEALFYVSIPAAAALVRRRYHGAAVPASTLYVIIATVWASSTVLSALHLAVSGRLGPWDGVVGDSLPATLFLFCPGLLLAVVVSEKRVLPGVLGRGWAPLMVLSATVWTVGSALRFQQTDAGTLAHDQLMAVASGLAVLAALKLPAHGSLTRLLGSVGTVSYGIYLWHWLMASEMARLGWFVATGNDTARWLANSVILVTLTLVPATMSWHLVERPLLERVQRRPGPKRAEVRPAA